MSMMGNMEFWAPYFQTNLDNPGYWSMKTPDMPWLQDTKYLHMLDHEPTTKQFLHVGSFPTSDAKPASAQIMALRADFGCVLLRASWSALSHGFHVGDHKGGLKALEIPRFPNVVNPCKSNNKDTRHNIYIYMHQYTQV